MNYRYRNPCQRWPQHDGYREAERIAEVALMPADEVPNTTVEWLWPDTIPVGHLTLVAGEPGGGKSFWMADLAARVSFVRPWPYADRERDAASASQDPKSKIENGSVIVVNSDDGFVDVQQPRLAAAQANMPNVGLMRRLPPGSRFSQIHSVGPVTDRLQALKAAVKEAGDCRLVIVDDLARFVRTGSGKINRADLLLALDSLKCIAGECHVAMVVVWRLERTGRATAKYLETFLPASAMAWLVGSDPYRDGLRWAVPLKNHFGPLPGPMAFRIERNNVVWQRPPDVLPADVTAAFLRKSDRRLEREQAGKWALARLAEGPVEARVLFDDASAFGFRDRTLRRALGELGLKPAKCGNDGPWLWGLERVQTGEVESTKTQDQSPKTSDSIQNHGTAWEGHPPETPFEDGQLAPESAPRAHLMGRVVEATCDDDGRMALMFVANDEPVEEGRAEDGQLVTNCEMQIGNREEAETPIQNRKSKIQNPEDDDFDETDVGLTEDDKITIVVLHPSAPGAEVSAVDAAARPQPP
ncbi:MAG TPA: AAA family ATPase [Pirellulales bacterium]|nr:AAA family ATPase [Pirellulales bacterium]